MGLLCIRLGNQDEMEKPESPEETSVEIESLKKTDFHIKNKDAKESIRWSHGGSQCSPNCSRAVKT